MRTQNYPKYTLGAVSVYTYRMGEKGGLARGGIELSNLEKYARIYTKYIQNTHNLYKMAAQKKPHLAIYPFGVASRPPMGVLDSFGFF